MLSFSALDPSDVGTIQSAKISKLFLRHTQLLSQIAKYFAEPKPDVLHVLGATYFSVALLMCQRIIQVTRCTVQQRIANGNRLLGPAYLLSWKRYTITRSVMTLVELKFKKTIHRAFDRLRGELSSDDSEAEIAKAFLAFLDQDAQKILVRHRKSGKTFEASYLDAWYKRLLSANPTEHEKHVTSYLAFAEGRLLLPYLDELRNAAG
jgi:hypothetical protein